MGTTQIFSDYLFLLETIQIRNTTGTIKKFLRNLKVCHIENSSLEIINVPLVLSTKVQSISGSLWIRDCMLLTYSLYEEEIGNLIFDLSCLYSRDALAFIILITSMAYEYDYSPPHHKGIKYLIKYRVLWSVTAHSSISVN